MIIKKLAVPLINEKILQQAEHVYIATAAISEAGFDFIRTRLPTKTKIDIVTGLDELTSPGVLRRIWRHYQDRITLRVYTRNVFHANVYVFNLPYRKSVGFTGSGPLTLEGLKDHEEIFNKVTDPKEVEALLSWYTSYYEFGEPLTEEMIDEYELIYPDMNQRNVVSRDEKSEFIALTTRGFQWDNIKFKNQYFKKEDYLVLGNAKAMMESETVQAERIALRGKFLQLHESIQKHVTRLKLHFDSDTVVNSIALNDPFSRKFRSIGLMYGRSDGDLKKYGTTALRKDLMTLQIVLQQKDLGVYLVIGRPGSGKDDRDYIKNKMLDEEYRKTFFSLLSSLGPGYWITIAGYRKPIEIFQQPEALWEFIKTDDGHLAFIIGKTYSPGDADISIDKIPTTLEKELDKLILLYEHLKDKR